MAKDVRRCSDMMLPPHAATSPEGQREEEDEEEAADDEQQEAQPPAPAAATAAVHPPPDTQQQQQQQRQQRHNGDRSRRRLWSPDESGVPGLALLTGEMRDLALRDDCDQENEPHRGGQHRGRLPSDPRLLRTPSPPTKGGGGLGAKPVAVPLGEGERLRRWMAAREGAAKPVAGGFGGGPLRALDGNAARRSRQQPNKEDARSKGSSTSSSSASILVHLPLEEAPPLPLARPPPPATPTAARSLLPVLLRHIMPPASPSKASKGSGGSTLVVVTRPRLKAWKPALRDHFAKAHGGGGGGGQGTAVGPQQQPQPGVMVYTGTVRERARLPLASVAAARLVLTTWEVFLARDVALGSAAEVGAWLGTGQQGDGRRAAPTATAGVAVGSRLMQLPWARVLVDEAQRLRGPAQRHKCAEGLDKLRAKHRWVLLDGTALLPAAGARTGAEWGPREDAKAKEVMAALFGEEGDEATQESMARSHRAVGVFRLPPSVV